VSVLTGYLGAGKTTLLNRLLSENHGKKYPVVINEFGELGVDDDLVADADEEVFEMNNGCICRTVRGDPDARSQIHGGEVPSWSTC
jgi:G3E family GTPase